MLALAQSAGVDMPITEAVATVVHAACPPPRWSRVILSRARKHEQS